MVLTDSIPRHRKQVTDAQLTEHEFRVGHSKFGSGAHEAQCHCTHPSRDRNYSHVYITREYGTPFYCTFFVPYRVNLIK